MGCPVYSKQDVKAETLCERVRPTLGVGAIKRVFGLDGVFLILEDDPRLSF